MSVHTITTAALKWEAYQRILELEHLVGRTPLYELRNLFKHETVSVHAKLEWQQFGGSVKARAAYQIIRKAMERNELREGMKLLDASSGNTAIAYALFCAVAGIPITLCVPENISPEKKHCLQQLHVELIYTSRLEGTDGAQYAAAQLHHERPGEYYYADQYNNENNWKAHVNSTATEIWEQTNGSVSHFVCGLGTTGTFTGTGVGLRDYTPSIQLVSCQPDAPMHGLEGWKHMETAKVPGIYQSSLANDQLWISTEESLALMASAAEHEGLFLSPSSAANLVAAIGIAQQLDSGVVVTVLPDQRKPSFSLNPK